MTVGVNDQNGIYWFNIAQCDYCQWLGGRRNDTERSALRCILLSKTSFCCLDIDPLVSAEKITVRDGQWPIENRRWRTNVEFGSNEATKMACGELQL